MKEHAVYEVFCTDEAHIHTVIRLSNATLFTNGSGEHREGLAL